MAILQTCADLSGTEDDGHVVRVCLSNRSEQVCLESSDLLHAHLALAGKRFIHYTNVLLRVC